MSTCHRLNQFSLLIFLVFIRLSSQEIAPVFEPDNELIKNHKQIDQLDRSSNDNLQAAEIVLPVTVHSPLNQTNDSKLSQNDQKPIRKRKQQSNKQYRPINERKNQFDQLAYNSDILKKNQLNELNNALLIQLANQKMINHSSKNQDSQEKYNSLLASLVNSANNNNELAFQMVPIYTTESPVNNLLMNSDPNQLAIQLYLRKLALAQLQKQARSAEIVETAKHKEKPKLQKRVSTGVPSSTTNLQQLANLNQLLQANQQQPIYTLLQPQQSTQPLYLALQPSFPTVTTSSNHRDSNNSPTQNSQVNSLIETGDKIFAKIKQLSTDVFNPKSSLNRQISEVLGVVSDVALVTLIGVPVLSLLSLGVSSLMQPLSLQLNRKLDRTKSAQNKQKTKSEEKKDNKDEKTAKSETNTHISQKNTKMLDKKSRLVSIMERAGDEFNHFKNLVEIAKNFELAFKKYNVERECKYRVLCEVSSSQQTNETDHPFLSSNLLRESRVNNRQVRSISNKMLSNDQVVSFVNQSKLNECTTNCSTSKSTVKESPTNKMFNHQRGLKNMIRHLIDENKESFISFITTVDHLMNRAQRSNLFNYLINEDQMNQAFKSDNKLFKTITERSKQLQQQLKDFLENLTVFQQVVSKESQNLDNSSNKMKYKMLNYYNLARSKRTANLNLNNNESIQSLSNNNLDNQSEYENVDVSGLKFVLSDLIHQLKFEQNQDNLILPLSRIWLNSYLSAYEFGQRHTSDQCKTRFFKCTTNFIGLNNGSLDKKLLDLETVISNNHPKNAKLKRKPNQEQNQDKV